ncbi:DUF6355 family natural product biosynthesis protein [Streptomyces sp. CA-181903]|uniref:DUF6355 family natural product biosynthesis protein n=1 Tax=Streptomyces sp. CA-181903 TaxID=3240055 RepID=UPI003D8D93B2
MKLRGSLSGTTARLGLAAVTLAGALACATVAPATAAPERIQGCGWNESRGGERAYYEHCATNTNVWIQVTRFPGATTTAASDRAAPISTSTPPAPGTTAATGAGSAPTRGTPGPDGHAERRSARPVNAERADRR